MSTLQLQERSVVDNSEEEGENNSHLESAIDNNYYLSNQPMAPLAVFSKILFSLINIFGANTSLPLEIF